MEIENQYNTWRNELGLDQSIIKVSSQLLDEAYELKLAESTGDRTEILSEMADIGLYLLAIKRLLDEKIEMYGADETIIYQAKIDRNNAKYSPVDMHELRETGLSMDEALKTLKERWDKTKDREYFEGV